MSLKPSIGQIVNPFFLQDGQDANPSAVSYPLNVADGVKGGSSAVDPLSLDIAGLPTGTLATTTELAINNGAVNEKTTLSDLATFLGGGGSSYIQPFLKTGGASWSGTGLVYDVTTLEYYFNGDKTTNATQVTLDASDPTYNRLDAIVVDEAGVVSVIKGDASASPISPSVDESHILIQYILVEAGSTQPTIAKEDIYLENVEWTTSTYTTGTATGSIDFDNAVSPKQGVKCISANADARLGARFVRTTSFDPYQYTMLSMWVRFTGSNVATNKSLNVRFENGAGALVANTINLFNFGLQRNLLNVWQLVVIPITSFGTLPTSVKGLKIIMAGGTVGQARQWDIDLISLTDNSVPSINEQAFNILKDGALVGQSSTINFKGAPITVTNDPINKKIDVEVTGGGGTPAGSDTQIQYNNAGAFGASSDFIFDQATSTFTATNNWEVSRSEINFSSNGGSDDLSASSETSFTGTPPTTFVVFAFGNIQIVNYINLVGGNFNQGDTITGSVSGAEGYVAYDDGVGQLYVSITNSIQFAATDVIDNANGVTADYDTSTTSDDIFFWFSTNGGGGGPIVITGTAQTLNDGIDITFGSVTGHGAGDSWQWSYKTLKNTVLSNRKIGSGILGGAINGQYFKSGSGSSIIQSMSGFFQNGNDDRIFPLSYYEDLTGNNSDKERAYYGFNPFKGDPSEPLNFTVYTRKGIGFGPSDISTFSVSSLNGIRMESDKIVYIGSPLFQVAEQIFSWTGNVNSTGITIDDVTQLITISNVPTYADDAAAATGGLTTGQLYKTTTLGTTSLNIVP